MPPGENIHGHSMDHCILVVDDEISVCNVIQKILSGQGYHVLTALSGIEALKELEKTPIDLLLIDLKMPVLDGLETLKRALKIQKNLKAILLTAYGTAATARDAMALGVSDFLAKPFDNQLLKKVVKEVLSVKR